MQQKARLLAGLSRFRGFLFLGRLTAMLRRRFRHHLHGALKALHCVRMKLDFIFGLGRHLTSPSCDSVSVTSQAICLIAAVAASTMALGGLLAELPNMPAPAFSLT